MKKNVIGRAGTAFALVGALALAGCSGSSAPSEDAVSSVLDPSDPVQVELWTYYNGTQQQAFEDLVKDFNATKGKDLGIVVTSSSQGGVNDLASACLLYTSTPLTRKGFPGTIVRSSISGTPRYLSAAKA